MKQPLALAVFLSVVLTGCAGADKKPLEGERLDVLSSSYSLKPDAELEGVMMRIPAPKPMGQWQQRGGTATHYVGHPSLPTSVKKAWKRSIGSGASASRILLNPPVVYGEKLFVVNVEGEVVALSTENGRELWETEIPVKEEELVGFSGGLAVGKGAVYVTTASGEVFALSRENGAVLWRSDVKIPLRVAPTLEGDTLLVMGHNNSLFALSAETGSLLWTHSGIEEEIGLIGGASAATDGTRVIAPYSSGEIYALNASDGAYVWHKSLSGSFGSGVFSSLTDIEALPVIAAGMVFAVNINGSLAALDLQTGKTLWQRQLSATQTPWVAGSTIFIVTERGEIAALHRETGHIRYVVSLSEELSEGEREENPYWLGPILAGDRLLVATNTGMAFALDVATGKLLRKVNIGEELSMPPIVSGNSLYFLTDDGNVLCYR